MGLWDHFPWYAWVVVIVAVVTAALGLLIPPTASSVIGLSVGQHVLLVLFVEAVSSLSIIGVLLYYGADSETHKPDDWKYDP
jgi:hypothetical protein